MLHGRATTVLPSPQMIFRMKNENFQGLLWSFFREKVCSTTTIVVLKKSPWFGIHSAWEGGGGCAKETAPVINIEINGVRGIWLTFLEWDIFLKKNWTDILYQKRFEQTFAVRSYHEFLPQNWSLSAQSSY